MKYNLFALDKLTPVERDNLIDFLPPGGGYKIGGEEYESHTLDFDVGIFADFINRISGEISITATRNFEKFLEHYNAFPRIKWVFYRNEIWHEITSFNEIRKDLFNWVFNRRQYYRNHARKYWAEATTLIGSMTMRGEQINAVLNVPLPQNQYLKAFLDEVSRLWSGAVSVHIYGKQREADYFDKLETWIDDIKSRNFSKVIVGEMNGLFNHDQDRGLKNTATHREHHNRILQILNDRGIGEIFYFTLVANELMMTWRNPPIYHRFLCSGGYVSDTLDKVF